MAQKFLPNVTEHRRLSGVTLVSGALLTLAFPAFPPLDYSGCVVAIGLCVKELGSASLHPVPADKAAEQEKTEPVHPEPTYRRHFRKPWD